MKWGVVVATHPANAEALGVLLASLRDSSYPLFIVINEATYADPDWVAFLRTCGTVLLNPENRFELGAISTILAETELDEFVFLQDTFEIKDVGFLDICFARSESVSFGPNFFHYAGKWRREALARLEIPVIESKNESIFHEHNFTGRYWAQEPVWILDADFHDGMATGFEERFGRMNMVLENQWFIKRKGRWF